MNVTRVSREMIKMNKNVSFSFIISEWIPQMAESYVCKP